VLLPLRFSYLKVSLLFWVLTYVTCAFIIALYWSFLTAILFLSPSTKAVCILMVVIYIIPLHCGRVIRHIHNKEIWYSCSRIITKHW
jgi:hypothetical protein